MLFLNKEVRITFALKKKPNRMFSFGIDLNKDQQFDLDDFQNSVGQNGGSPKPGNWRAPSPGEAQYTPNSYQPRTTSRNGTPIQNLYEQSSYPPTSDAGPNGINAIVPSTLGVNGSQQVDPRNPRNLFIDPNPQIIRRPAQGGVQTYTQNVRIRFLQPPPPPPPGVRSPLIVRIFLRILFISATHHQRSATTSTTATTSTSYSSTSSFASPTTSACFT